MQAHFKYFQIQIHVQTARDSPDFSMDKYLCKNSGLSN